MNVLVPKYCDTVFYEMIHKKKSPATNWSTSLSASSNISSSSITSTIGLKFFQHSDKGILKKRLM